MDFFQCMSLTKAQSLIIDSLSKMIVKSEKVDLIHALGRVAAKDVIAKEDLPPFSRSTVDGFAVRSMDTFGANEGVPALFTVTGEVAMGKEAAMELLSGHAVAIPTGGMLPAGADAVVMLEYTEQHDSNELFVLKVAAPGENVVAKGEDIESGTVIVARGQKIAPQHIGALAACGCVEISVCKRVEVAIISTGDELVDIDEPLEFGQIRDVNSYALGAMLTEAGCIVKPMGIVKDNFEKFFAVLENAVAACQFVIISGGSSVGARDYTVKAIEALGTPGVLIHGLAIKPGKPTIYGMIGKVPVFGLPGHPVAAMTVCEQLVMLTVRKLMGQENVGEKFSIPAFLNRNVASVPGRDDFIPVQLSKEEGQYVATPILGKSGMIRIIAEADGLIQIPADKSGIYYGETVEVLLLKKRE